MLMPTRAPWICGCGRCVPGGQRCVCQQQHARAIEQARPSARERGYDSNWEKARAGYLREHKWCVGRVVGRQCGKPAIAVDHIQPPRGDTKLFWRRSNWQALCRTCHSSKTASQDGGFGNPRMVCT
jgi:5-methylcytosine-specific restriction endonuclease McrA